MYAWEKELIKNIQNFRIKELKKKLERLVILGIVRSFQYSSTPITLLAIIAPYVLIGGNTLKSE